MSKINVGKVSPVPKGNWGGTNAAYEKLNMVNYKGVLYIAKQDIAANSNIAITNTNYWMQATNKWNDVNITLDSEATLGTGTITEGTNGTNTLNLTMPGVAYGTEIIDNTAGDGDTDVVWSADKSRSEVNDIISSREKFISKNFVSDEYDKPTISYLETQGYWQNNGVFVSYSNIRGSEKIYVTGTISFTGSAWAATAAIVACDSDDNVLMSIPGVNIGDTVQNHEDEIITLPTNTSYIRVNDITGKKSTTLTPVIKQYFSVKTDRNLINDFISNNFVIDYDGDVSITYEETNGFWKSDGTFTEYSNISGSVKIYVNGTISLTGSAWAAAQALVAYDASNNVLLAIPGENIGDTVQNYENEIITLPTGTSYVRVNDITEKKSTALSPTIKTPSGYIAKKAKNSENADYSPKNILYGKKLVTAGDSYTRASFSAPYDEKNYGYYTAKRNSMTFINAGINGSIMALDKTYVDDPDHVSISTRNPFSYQRYLNIPSDTDYLTIWFGINDRVNTYLGTINDESNTTFYGAWNVVLRYYLTNFPFMKLGIIVTTGANNEYRQAVRDVAEKWGYPTLDWVADKKTPAFFDRDDMSEEAKTLRRTAYGYNDYSAHPNPQWHIYASTIYENFLRSL